MRQACQHQARRRNETRRHAPALKPVRGLQSGQFIAITITGAGWAKGREEERGQPKGDKRQSTERPEETEHARVMRGRGAVTQGGERGKESAREREIVAPAVRLGAKLTQRARRRDQGR